jgi:hypothetical protein
MSQAGAATEDIDKELDLLFAAAASINIAGAAINMQPKSEKGLTTLYGEFRIENSNSYLKFEQLSQISPHTFIPLAKLGLSIVSGLRLESKDQTALTRMQDWFDKINLTQKAQSLAFCMARDGTTVAYLDSMPEDGIEGYTDIQILPMKYLTLIPKGKAAGDKGGELWKGKIEQAILNENLTMKGENKQTIFDRSEISLFRIFHEGYVMKDIMGRETYGMYGMSMLIPIDRPLKNLMDMVEGFAGYMRRYGIGRLHLNVTLAEQLRTQGKKQEAKELLQDIMAAQRRIGPNEDLVSYGTEVKSLSTGGATGIDTMKASLEADIHIGLLQSPLGMGDSKGSTYAAGKMSEEDRYLILESMQHIFIKTMQEEIINPQLKKLGMAPGIVTIEADKLDLPYVDVRTLGEAFLSGAISMSEYREAMGFESEKPVEEGNNGGPPAPLSAAPPASPGAPGEIQNQPPKTKQEIVPVTGEKP